jgi:hypothetical protein
MKELPPETKTVGNCHQKRAPACSMLPVWEPVRNWLPNTTPNSYLFPAHTRRDLTGGSTTRLSFRPGAHWPGPLQDIFIYKPLLRIHIRMQPSISLLHIQNAITNNFRLSASGIFYLIPVLRIRDVLSRIRKFFHPGYGSEHFSFQIPDPT